VDTKKVTDTIDLDVLKNNGLAGNNDLIKILGRGELSVKLMVTAHKFSASALQAIEAKGGTANTL
jgi:large subunit ribosomal protein L15